MLQPRKHLNLDTSVLRVSAIVLRELSKGGAMEFEKLRQRVTKRVGPDGNLVFLPSLGLLYLLGKVDYHEQNDLVELRP